MNTGAIQYLVLNIGLYSLPLQIVLRDDMNYFKAVEGSRLLLNETGREPDLSMYQGSKEGFSMWQQALDPLYYQRPLEERFEVAMSLAYRHNRPEVLRSALARGALPSLAHCMTDRNGETLLHAITWNIGDYMYVIRPKEWELKIMNGINPK